MQCEEWADANSELFKEAHNEAVHKNSYKSRLYELISASLGIQSYGYYTIWFPTRYDTMVLLTDRKLFANCFLSGMTLWCFLPTGNYLLKISYPA